VSLSLAERLLQDLGVDAPENIDVDAIALCVGAQVRYDALSGCEARIVGTGEKAIITVRLGTHLRRKRFSAAHELGHWALHRGRSFICRSDDIGNYQGTSPVHEREADGYAADLLLPAYLFRPLASRLRELSFEGIRDIADRFSTSLTATALRVIDANTHATMLIAHDGVGRRWFRRSRDVPDRWFPRAKLDPDSYAYDLVHGSGTDERSHTMDATAWFDSDEANAKEVTEQSIRIGDGATLTLLTFKDEEMLLERSRR
jgi:hypothetical protein